jgi:VIT1/CCC1 family predicted Fe2+/Mn2+ transporter
MASPSEPKKPQGLQEYRDELRASLAARRELSPELEETLVTNFLQQIEHAIDAKMDARMAQYTKTRAVGARNTTAVMGTILGIAIPLVVVGGIFGGATAIVAVCGLILILSLVALFKT